MPVIREPESETINMLVNGSSIPVKLIPVKPFVIIMRMNISLKWANANGQFSWIQFGDGTALSNGIELEYNGKLKFDSPVKDNHDWKKYAGIDTRATTDTKSVGATKALTLASRISFFKWCPSGFDMREKDIALIINDNLSTGFIEGTVTFQGWVWNKTKQSRRNKI